MRIKEKKRLTIFFEERSGGAHEPVVENYRLMPEALDYRYSLMLPHGLLHSAAAF